MDTRQLRTFVKLAQTLNYAAAARDLYISQPAVTQQIERLERELGARLFDRDTRKVELTPAGRVFYRDCTDVLSRLDQAKAQVRERAHLFESRLRIACSSTMDIDYLPRLLGRYRAAQPGVHLYVSHGTPVDRLAALNQGRCDVLLGARSHVPMPAGMEFRRLREGRFVLVAPKGHPLAEGSGPLHLDALSRESLIFLEDEACPPEMAEVQDRIVWELPDAVAYYSGSSVISATMIEAGIGLAIMPDFACPKRDTLATRVVEGFDPIEYGVFWAKRDKSEQTSALVECAAEVYAGER